MGTASARAQPESDDWQPVTARFAAHAAAHPDRIAIEAGDAALSYAELATRVDAFANRLAAALGKAGVGGEAGAGDDRVIGVCLDRDVNLPGWLLAILRVGAAYLPLDPTLPAARLATVIADAKPVLIVASRRHAASLPPNTIPLLVADDAGDAAPSAPVATIRPDTLAYIIYTSGSTGRPKGVEIEHGALAALMTTMAASPGFAAGQRMLGLTRISFDLSVPDMFLPFATGGTLALIDLDVAADPARLAAAIARYRPDLVQGTPSTWRTLLEWGWQGLPGVRLLAGGEAMTRDLADRLLPRCGELWNIYGPTEATVWATATRVRPGTGVVPIGWPMSGVAVQVVDEAMRPVRPGNVGEIVIGGPGVARGYRGRPDLTADRFVRLSDGERVYRTGDLGRFAEDGALFCLGRSDDQVKLRGFRIELGDVEFALAAHPDVAWCAARLWHDAAGEPILVAYLVPRLGTAPLAGAVKRALAERLPPYMIPDRIVSVSAMPLTPNGKVDRAALPNPFAAAVPGPAAGDESVSARLASIWCELLGLAVVDPTDDFFELGGYSLMTVRLARQIDAHFGVKLSLTDMMRCSRLGDMADRIGRGPGADEGPPPACMLLNAGGDRTPIFWLDAGPLMRTVMRELDPDQPAFTLNLSVSDETDLDGETVAIAAIAARLRDRLTAFHPAGRVHIGGWCRWGIVAFELARQLESEGRDVGLLILLDADRPRARPATALRRRLGILLLGRPSSPEAPSFSQRVEMAASAYRVSTYRGEVLLVRPRAAAGNGGWHATLGARLRVAVTGGDHQSMVRQPHAREIAAAMMQRLDAIDHGARGERRRDAVPLGNAGDRLAAE